MKRLVLAIVLILGLAVPAEAQFHLGGGVSFASRNGSGLSINISPEIGYRFNNYLLAGGKFTYRSSSHVLGVDPYLRCYMLNNLGTVRLSATAHAPMEFTSEYQSFGIYLQPGLCFRTGENVWLEIHFGAFGWGAINYFDSFVSGWEAVVNSDNISVGVVFDI